MINATCQKEAFPLAGLLSKVDTGNACNLSKPDICSRLAGGVCTAHHPRHKGYSDFVQHTGPVISGQSRQDVRPHFGRNLLMALNSVTEPEKEAFPLAGRLSVFGIGYAWNLTKPDIEKRDRRGVMLSKVDINGRGAGGAILRIPKVLSAVGNAYRVCNAVATEFSESIKKGSISNATLWNSDQADGGFFRVQKSTLEQNQQLAVLQDNHAGISGEHYESFVGHRVTDSKPVQSFGDSCFAFLRWRRLMSRNIVSGKKLPVLLSGVTGCLPGGSCFFFMGQPFSSMPRDCSSLRRILFIQAETEASPSCASACFIPSSRDGSTRREICLLPLPFISMVDIWLTPDYFELAVDCMTSVNQKATPRSGGTLPRRLTTNDRFSIEAAMQNYTTPLTGRNSLTPNKFTWCFLAVSRSDRNAKPCRMSVEAHTEREARQVLAPHFILSLAARLPLQGIREIVTPSTIEKTSTVQEVSYA